MFSDLTEEESSHYFGLLRDEEEPEYDETEERRLAQTDIAERIDWRELGGVNEIRNQGACGSCWAFSACGAIEGAHFAHTGELIEIAEQQLMDCSTGGIFGNHGCSGGYVTKAFKYYYDNPAILDTEYPYRTKKSHRCHSDEHETTDLKLTNFHKIKQKDQP